MINYHNDFVFTRDTVLRDKIEKKYVSRQSISPENSRS